MKNTTEEEAAVNDASDKKKSAAKSIPALKLKVLEAMDHFVSDRIRAKAIKLQVDDKSFQTLSSADKVQIGQEAEEVRVSLDESFKGLITAFTPFKNAVKVAGQDWDQSTADLVVKCDENLHEEVNSYRTVLRKLISAKASIQPSPAILTTPGVSGLSISSCPVKLAKVDNILFSGEYRDFASFKRNFETIVVPNRDPADIGLRLRQSLPAKHVHLIDNIEPCQYVKMMDVLKAKFGNPRHIVSACLRDIDKLKTPITDESFITFVEDLEKVERDLKSVELVDRLYHETVLTKLEHLLPEKVKGDWSEYACDNDLITDEAVIEDVFKGFMLFMAKYKKRVD